MHLSNDVDEIYRQLNCVVDIIEKDLKRLTDGISDAYFDGSRIKDRDRVDEKLALWHCWHFVTVTLVAMAAGYAVLSHRPDLAPFGAYLTAQAIGISALSFIDSGIEKAPPLKSPPAILGAIIAAFGLAALFQG